MSSDFLSGLSVAVSEIERRAKDLFGSLDHERFNWSPREDSWSIGQCLDHLVRANDPYFRIFESVATGTKRTTVWERLPLLPRLFGAAVFNTVRPEMKRKARAPRIFQPRKERVPIDILNVFCLQQRKLVEAMVSLEGVDLDKTVVTSPVAPFITYSLWHAVSIIAAHEERHLQQAERVLRAMTDGGDSVERRDRTDG